jgi:pSer/pThr/pTyr-binding forkhead associated (FHA) protein
VPVLDEPAPSEPAPSESGPDESVRRWTAPPEPAWRDRVVAESAMAESALAEPAVPAAVTPVHGHHAVADQIAPAAEPAPPAEAEAEPDVFSWSAPAFSATPTASPVLPPPPAAPVRPAPSSSSPLPRQTAPPTTPIPVFTPTTWIAAVSTDREYYDLMQRKRVPFGSEIEFPVYVIERRFPMSGSQMRIGRRSAARGLEPEIDLADPPADPGVSRLHAILIAAPNGTWAVLDPGSANGTMLNGRELAVGEMVTLRDGDRINLGAWTAIIVHRG